MNFTKRLLKDFATDADRRVSAICRSIIVLMVVVMVLNKVKVFKITNEIYPTLIISMVILFVPTILHDILKLEAKWARYLLVTLLVFMSGLLYAILSYHVIIMLAFLVVVSCLYCDKKCVIYAYFLSVPMMVISHLIALQLKVVPDEPLITLFGTIVYGVIPRAIELLAITVVCASVTNRMQKLVADLIEKNNELYEDQQTLLGSLAELIEAQSHETGRHVKRVSAYTEILCKALGMSEEETWKVSVASMMHDVGKIAVPKEILYKPARLSEEEFEEVKKHVDYGYDILHNSPGEIIQIAADIAQQHHERYDGVGYQHNLHGENINLFARCVAIADVFDALVSKRCYKEQWTPEDARKEIMDQSGKQFDPKLTALFDEHFDEFLEVMRKYPDN
ncbi:MAG: HD domain-containing protein [Lachnospiraceae bacterium]|nr:HD domain-containing protein [Lachnospiraceae bacterium]